MDRNEAIKVIRDNWPESRHQLSEALQTLIPEFQENEEERIKEDIIRVFTGEIGFTTKEEAKKYIAWLEKQGKQKPEIKYIYPKFRVGDVIEPVKPNGYYTPVRVKYIGDGNYSCESDDYKSFLSFPICNENEYVLTEQKSAWSEDDEKLYTWCASAIQTRYNDGLFTMDEYRETRIWLKSLKERMKGE